MLRWWVGRESSRKVPADLAALCESYAFGRELASISNVGAKILRAMKRIGLDIAIRCLGLGFVALGIAAGMEMTAVRDAAGAAAPSTREVVFAILGITLLFSGTGMAIFGSALFRRPED